MTPGEIAQIITAFVLLGGFILSARSTSYNELKGLFDSLKKDSEEREKKMDTMEMEIKTLTRQNISFKRYISKLIAQLEEAKITPAVMEEDDL